MNIALNEDCMEVMRRYPEKYFDIAVVDPPYFSGPERRRFYGNEKSRTGVLRNDYPVIDKWKVPGPEYFAELERVSKRYIVWGCNYFNYHFAPGRIVWDKCNGSSSFSDCEIAATNFHDSVRLFSFMWNGMQQGKNFCDGHIMQGNKKLNEVRIHPTQKPTELYRWIFTKYAKPGHKILDTHLGSGTSRRAAYDFNLDFVGCELSKEYFERQENAFCEYVSQMRIEM